MDPGARAGRTAGQRTERAATRPTPRTPAVRPTGPVARSPRRAATSPTPSETAAAAAVSGNRSPKSGGSPGPTATAMATNTAPMTDRDATNPTRKLVRTGDDTGRDPIRSAAWSSTAQASAAPAKRPAKINGADTSSLRAKVTMTGTAARATVSAAGPRWATRAVGPT